MNVAAGAGASKGWCYVEGVVADPQRLFEQVRDEVSWTRQMKSRQTASMGIPYNYAGASYPQAPWHPAVAALARQLVQRVGFEATNCLLNRYPTGRHTIGWHADDVSILAPGTGIAIVSLGAVRTLQLRSGSAPDFVYHRLPLAPGSLLLLSAELQAHTKHAMKAEPEAGERISLSFRQLTHASEVVDRPAWGAS